MNVEDTLRRLGIASLSPMQQEAYKAVTQTANNDIVILSPTGSGKTLAYLLPLAEQIDPTDNRPQAIVVTPSRELALQSNDVLRSMATGLRSFSCYGGRMAMDEHRAMRQIEPQVIFGTPGRLNDHIDKGNINVYAVRWLVIDEFDKCLALGFHDEMAQLLKSLPAVRRRMLLSATDADEIPSFVRLGRATKIDFSDSAANVARRIELFEVRSKQKDKLETLSKLLRHIGDESSIVFLNYRDSVERTAEYLRQEGFAVSAFHGGLGQRQREDALYRFSNASSNIFASTDLASRGLDICDVGNIIHYHMPQDAEAYTHRTGRTARWDKSGRAWFILGPGESLPPFISERPALYTMPDALPQPPQPRMVTVYIGKGKKDKISKGDIVGFLCKKGGLGKDDVGRIDVRERYSYAAVAFAKLKELLNNVQGEKIKGIKTVVEVVR